MLVLVRCVHSVYMPNEMMLPIDGPCRILPAPGAQLGCALASGRTCLDNVECMGSKSAFCSC